MGKYSHSRLSSFEQCPQRYKFEYIDRVEVELETTVEAFMGSIVHQVLEKLYRDFSFGKLDSREELLEYYKHLWESMWDDNILIVKQDQTKDDYKRRGAQFILNYYAANEPFNEDKTLGLETEYLLDLGNNHKYHIRMDRLSKGDDGTYFVHDYKTSSSMKSQEKLDEDRQLAMYSLWVKENFPDAFKVKLVWHYLAFGKRMESERSVQDLELLKQDVIKKIGIIESAIEFPPIVSPLCGWCLYQSICPAFERRSVQSKLTDQQ